MATKDDLLKTLEKIREAKSILLSVVNRTDGMLPEEYNGVVSALFEASLKPGPWLKIFFAELNGVSDWWLGPLGVRGEANPPAWAMGILDQVTAAEAAAARDWANESS